MSAAAQTTMFNGVEVPGVVVAHSPKSSGEYLGSPSIAILPNGDYLASHRGYGDSHIYRSTDRGVTWTNISILPKSTMSTLFTLQGNTYAMGIRSGRVYISRSTDGGLTWTQPTDAFNGRLTREKSYHSAAVPMVIHNGRIWRAIENTIPDTGWGHRFLACVMSAPVDSDLLDRNNWTFSNEIGRDPTWLDGDFHGWCEGNMVVTPEGNLVNIPRVDHPPHGDTSALIRVNEQDHTISFNPENDFIEFPGGGKKFVIRYDPVSQQYLSLTNWVPPGFRSSEAQINAFLDSLTPEQQAPNQRGTLLTSNGFYNFERTRNTLALISSTDLVHWNVRKVLLHHPDTATHGLHYLDWQFDGNDIIGLSRTAYDDGLGGADNQHNANFITFHRFENYLDFESWDSLLSDTGNNRVLKYSLISGAGGPWWLTPEVFAEGEYAGETLANPLGLVRNALGQVFIGEQRDGGRILRFDADGGFLGVVANEGQQFTGNPEQIILGPDDLLYMSTAFGTGSDRIYSINTQTNDVDLFIDTTDGVNYTLNNPRGLAFATDGTLFVANRQEGNVLAFDGDGSYLETLVSGLDQPQTLLWDEGNQQLLIGFSGTLQVAAVDLLGNVQLLGDDVVGNVLDIMLVDDELFISDYTSSQLYHLYQGEWQTVTQDESLYHPGHMLLRQLIDGDINGDGSVDVSDLGILATNYKTGSGKSREQGDLTGDGIVDESDLSILAENYGNASDTTTHAVPEPGILSLLIGAFSLLISQRSNIRR
ncbi:MAG: hypothetical protein JXM70_22765 [Pirellulales bacterium]|nr:hypothetical protein [Pirellulales bacterium]